MATFPVKQTYTFYDVKQQQARMAMFITADGAVAATAVADGNQLGLDLAALSNSSSVAGSIRGNGPFTSSPAPVSPGASSTYEDVADKAVFVFQDASGGLHKYQVPCPKSTIFLADQETIDFTNAAVKQFVADVTFTTFAGTAPLTAAPNLTRQNTAIVSSVGGYRRRGKTPRKFNIYTRNPALTGQGE